MLFRKLGIALVLSSLSLVASAQKGETVKIELARPRPSLRTLDSSIVHRDEKASPNFPLPM